MALSARVSTSRPFTASRPRRVVALNAVATKFKVEIEHEGKLISLEVPKGENILAVALDQGLDLPHDCKLGVCMTCPAKMVSGNVEQGAAMLSDDVTAKGYALLCVAQPTSDCRIRTISEEELLEQQFGQ